MPTVVNLEHLENSDKGILKAHYNMENLCNFLCIVTYLTYSYKYSRSRWTIWLLFSFYFTWTPHTSLNIVVSTHSKSIKSDQETKFYFSSSFSVMAWVLKLLRFFFFKILKCKMQTNYKSIDANFKKAISLD